MRRLFLLCFFPLLTTLAIFHRELSHYVICTSANFHSGCSLSYKRLQIQNGQILLTDVIASNSGLFAAEVKQVSIKYSFPNSFQIRLQSPNISLSPETLNLLENKERSYFTFSLEVVDGNLNWTDPSLGSSSMQLTQNDQKTECLLKFPDGFFSYRDGTLQWKNLPLAWAPHLAKVTNTLFPIAVLSGSSSGIWDGKMLHAEIDHFSACHEECQFKGSLAIDWQSPSSFSSAPEFLRLSLHEGQLITPYSSIEHVDILATYQSGKWGMIEGKGESESLPLTFKGKGFFSSLEEGWMKGSATVGFGIANMQWSEGSGTIQYDGISAQEVGCIQKLAQLYEPRIASLKYVNGSLSGQLLLSDTIEVESMQITDLFIENEEMQLGCKKLEFELGDLTAEQIVLNGFQGEGVWSQSKQELLVTGSYKKTPLQFNWKLGGMTEGLFGALQFAGNVHVRDQLLHAEVSKIEGIIPDFPLLQDQLQGRIVSGSADLVVGFANGIQVEHWEAKGKIVEGTLPDWDIYDLEVNLSANKSAAYLNGKGLYTCPNGYIVRLNAAKILLADDSAHFDLRIEQENCDLVRVVGSKQGSLLQLDNEKSHLCGSKFKTNNLMWGTGTLANGHIESHLHWPMVSLFLNKLGIQSPFEFPAEEIRIQADFNEIQGLKLALASGEWQAKAIYRENLWNVTAANEHVQGSCDLLIASDSLFHVKNGRVIHNESISCGFEGKILEDFSADLLLSEIVGDLSLFQVAELQGVVHGHGCMKVSYQRIESDLDFNPISTTWKGALFESLSPIHLFCSSDNGILIKGLDARVSKGSHEARSKVGLIEFNRKRGRIAFQKGSYQVASDLLTDFFPQFDQGIDAGSELDFKGTFDCSCDFSDIHCLLERATISIAGHPRQLENLQLSVKPHEISGAASLTHRDQQAEIHFDLKRELSNLQGVLVLEEKALAIPKVPLSISWTSDPAGLTIHSIKGSFAGLQTSFQSTNVHTTSQLVGSVSVDFNHLCKWIDPMLAAGVQGVGAGSGYELKGILTLDRKDLSQYSFKGILGGKQVQLFNYQFRTMMSDIELIPHKLQIQNIRVSDSAVTAKIDQVLIESKNKEPWKIHIPLLTLEDLRPSLLKGLNDKERTLSPLIIREFSLRDFTGVLDDEKSYKASGELSFVNTFKREETFFDLPSNFFGRIIGLDLDLLVPVIGDLTFDLKNGYIQLKELKNSYSEGERSEFFLADANAKQRIGLRGDLEISVKMKQFVLFALTEGFMISIDGSVSDPRVSLQKN